MCACVTLSHFLSYKTSRTGFMKKWCTLTGLFLFVIQSYAQVSSNSYFKDGFTLFQSGNYEQALNSYNLAIGLEPERNYFYYHRGNAFRMLGKKEEAKQDYIKCNTLKPTPEAYYAVGQIYFEQKDSVNAFSSFVQANELRPDIEKLNYFMALYHYKKGADSLALFHVEKYINKFYNKVDGYVLQHQIYLSMGNYKAALGALDQALTRDYNDWKIYYNYYQTYKKMNQTENAIYNLTMVIELGNKKPQYYKERAQLYEKIGNMQKAKEDNEYAADVSKAK